MLKAVSVPVDLAADITIGSSVITGGTDTRVLFDDAGVVGEDAGLTYVKATDALTAGVFIPTSATVPVNGLYLSAANTVALAANTANVFTSTSTVMTMGVNVNANGSSGYRLGSGNASSTAPSYAPNRQDTTTGIGAQASGNISLIVAATEKVRIISTGLTIISGNALTLGNAATTGLSAGVLAGQTNASIVLTDSAGQAYRIPCII